MKKFMFLLLSALLAVMTSCALSLSDIETVNAAPAVPSDMVKLFFAKSQGIFMYNGISARVKGFIEIANVAYSKDVAVRYQANGGVWKEVSARYVKALNGKEVWMFELSGLPYGSADTFTLKFAVRYRVNGAEYWDNNGGADYTLRMAPGDTLYGDTAYGKSIVALDIATGYIYESGAYESAFTGQVFTRRAGTVRNLYVRYSIDGWKTYKEVQATPAFSGYMPDPDTNKLRWSFYTTVPASTTKVQFAVRYNVNGVDSWDNNFGFGSDYSITRLPGDVRTTDAW